MLERNEMKKIAKEVAGIIQRNLPMIIKLIEKGEFKSDSAEEIPENKGNLLSLKLPPGEIDLVNISTVLSLMTMRFQVSLPSSLEKNKNSNQFFAPL